MKNLFPFQINALKSLESKNKVLLALDMGLGKTFTGLNWLKQKDLKQTYTLILCQKNKIEDWYDEVNEVFGDKRVFKIKTQNDLKQLIPQINENDFIIMNYSIFTLYTKKVLRWWDKIKNLIPNLIFDESQGLRNRTSLISKYTYVLSINCKYVLLLSGDPTPTGYQDLYQQLKVLNVWVEGYSWNDFLKEFCLTKVLPGTSVLLVTGYKNTERLLSLLNSRSYFLKTEDAIGLPEKQNIYHRDFSKLPYYQEFQNNKIILFEDENKQFCETVSEGPLTELLYLRELTSGFIKTKEVMTNIEKYVKTHENKISLLREVLENSNDQTVVFYNFKEERKQIIELLNSLNLSYIRIDGEIHELNQLNNQRIILVQYQSGSKGIDGLQFKSNRIIYYSPTLSGELFKQSIKRIHRIGQSKSCIYHFLINSKLEELIFKRLQSFEDFTVEMFQKLKREELL